MASESVNQLHILMIPLLAPGHTIPMIAMAKMLAQRRNVMITIVTTPLNAIRYGPKLQQDINSGLPVRFLELPFPATENGLPEGCESAEALPGLHLLPNFSAAVDMLQQRLEERFDSLNPRPVCIISDKFMLWSDDTAQLERVRESESRAYGMVINTFEELEQEYVKEFKKLKGGKVWCLGPLSLSNSNDSGYNASINDQGYLKWLDSKEPGSVVYACFGSSSQIILAQLIELGLALEASKSPFIWVIRAGDRANEVEKWLSESGFETRIKDRGLIIRNWAPQPMILTHPSVGGFLTHCGWNSILEGVSAGVPMITWPQFAEQFLNEKLIVQVLGVGVSVGARVVVHWGQEDKFGVTVKSEQVKTTIEQVMHVGNEIRKKAKAIGMMAKKAVEEGGSSHHSLTLLIQDLLEVSSQKPLT
ncbi:hypothetical protein R6Q57_017908 [Mikania cordata]